MKLFIFLVAHLAYGNELYHNYLLDMVKYNMINIVTVFSCNGIRENKMMYSTFARHNVKISIRNLPQVNYFDDIPKRYREVFIVNPRCDGVKELINEGVLFHKFTNLYLWIFVDVNGNITNYADKMSPFGEQLFWNMGISVNSQVVWTQLGSSQENYVLYDIYQVALNMQLNIKLLGFYPDENIQDIFVTVPTIGKRRRNLQQVWLRSSSVIQYSEEFTFMDDLRKRQFDPFTKWNYPLTIALGEDLNYRYNNTITNNFGWDTNGTGQFDGFMGMFQRKERDFGMLGVLMRTDRFPIIDFTAETIQVRARIIFRKPPLSSLSNIFILPFNTNVWCSCCGLCLLAAFAIGLQLWLFRTVEQEGQNINISDAFTFVAGAVCQQGSAISPSTVSSRLTMLLVFVASLFLFTSYSANIVALLQTPSTSIKTLIDLILSPLAVGIQDITYNYVFLKESKDLITKNLYERKVLPRGNKGFLQPDEGMSLVQRGMFAFQVDAAFAYEYMSLKYTEQERCDLTEIEAYRLPMQTVPIQKHSPYRDLFTQRLRWQKETGIMDRTRRRWVPQKPLCDSTRSGYVSVGLTEFMPALRILFYGTIFAFALFILEICHFNYPIYKRKFRHIVGTKTRNKHL